MLKIAMQGVYWTIQGEGHYVGEPMIFIRLAGCSVGCQSCDTNYSFYREADEASVVAECVQLREKHKRAIYAWVTGGEPTDQDLSRLNSLLWDARFKPCIATAGTRLVEQRWWHISVSPHSGDFVQRSGSEIKLVPELNGLDLEKMDLSRCAFADWWVQPMAGSKTSLKKCCDWLEKYRHFRLSPQSHKSWGLP